MLNVKIVLRNPVKKDVKTLKTALKIIFFLENLNTFISDKFYFYA
jgi:hypothetical protein